MEKKQFFSSLISFSFTLLFLSVAIFAWFTLREQAGVDDIVLNVNELKSDIILKVKKNDGEFIEVETREELDALFYNTLPSDVFLFNLLITNKSSRESYISVSLNGITSINPHEGFDMRDVFYIEEGIISVNGVNQEPLNINENNQGEFNLYNLNNIIKNLNIELLNNFLLDVNEDLEIEFSIVYDQNVSAIEFQDGKLSIGGIYIYNK